VEAGEEGAGGNEAVRGSSSRKLRRGIEAEEGPERYVRCIARGRRSSGISRDEEGKMRESNDEVVGAARAIKLATGENAEDLSTVNEVRWVSQSSVLSSRG
jgi:hypothetical protein